MTSSLVLAIALISASTSEAMQEQPRETVPIPTPAPSPQDPLATGQVYLDRCERAVRGEGPGEVFGICIGFVEGAIARDSGGESPHLFCIPRGSSRGALMDGIFTQLQSDDSLLGMTGPSAVLIAMHRAFPAGQTPREECVAPWHVR